MHRFQSLNWIIVQTLTHFVFSQLLNPEFFGRLVCSVFESKVLNIVFKNLTDCVLLSLLPQRSWSYFRNFADCVHAFYFNALGLKSGI
jgi:hypothetical protein